MLPARELEYIGQMVQETFDVIGDLKLKYQHLQLQKVFDTPRFFATEIF